MKRVVIVGAGGYSGAELTGLAHGHDDIQIVGLFGSRDRDGESFADLYPRWRGEIEMPIMPTDLQTIIDLQPDAAFLATPHAVSHDLAPPLLNAGVTVFDLSGAFRLPTAAAYPEHYGFEHLHPGLLESAAYGLAELNADDIVSADLVAVAGCYPTSIILPLGPLAAAGAIDTTFPVIADSMSGVSGAGRSPKNIGSLFCEVSCKAYGVLSHRHTPEICTHSGADVIFTPHLVPMDRGILSTIHINIETGWHEDDVRSVLMAAYADAPCVRLLQGGSWPTVNGVKGTNYCDIGLAFDSARQHLIMVSAIDNLVKGAAGQALQCFDIRYGLHPSMAPHSRTKAGVL